MRNMDEKQLRESLDIFSRYGLVEFSPFYDGNAMFKVETDVEIASYDRSKLFLLGWYKTGWKSEEQYWYWF